MIQNQERGSEFNPNWTLSVADLAVHHGIHPAQVPEGAWSVATGVDGRNAGAVRRGMGNKLFMDLIANSSWQTAVLNNAGITDWRDRTAHECFPFTVAQTNGSGHVYGLVIWNRSTDKIYLAYFVDGYHDPTNPYSPAPIWQTWRLVTATTDLTATVRPHVYSTGRFIFLCAQDGSATYYPMVAWFDYDRWSLGGNNGKPNDNGFVFDYMGVPATTNLQTDNSVTNAAGSGYTIKGQYKISGRLVDTNRNRVTNMAPVDAVPDTWYNDKVQKTGSFTLQIDRTGVNELGSGTESRKNWDEYQAWASLGSQDDDVLASDELFLGDQMGVYDAWLTTVPSPNPIVKANLFSNATRSDTTTVDEIPFSDLALASATQYDPTLDVFRPFGNIDLSIQYLSSISVYQGITVASMEESGFVKLIWSDLRDVRLENFPFTQEYITKFRMPPGSDDRVLIGMREASDYLYILGDGPVYRARRVGNYFDVVQVHDSFALVGRDALCSNGTAVFAVCTSGVWMFDGSTGSATRVQSLDRLLRDRWMDKDLWSEIQCAYDSALDAVYILCPGLAEAVVLWLGSNRVTMEQGCYFRWLREANIISDSGDLGRRAMFVTWGGRAVYPRFYRDPDVVQYTFGGYEDTLTTIPTTLNAKITSASNTTFNLESATKIDLVKADASSYSFTATALGDATVAVLSGPLAGNIYACLTNTSGSSTSSLYIRGTVSTTSLANAWVAISPVPFMLVGGPLNGDSQMPWFQRKHILWTAPVPTKFEGETTNFTGFAAFRCGITSTNGIFDAEELQAPDASGGSARIVARPDPGPLSRWVSMTSSDTVLAECPVAGTAPSETQPWLNVGALNPPEGATQNLPYPVLVCDASNFLFDLLSCQYTGQISPSYLNSASE